MSDERRLADPRGYPLRRGWYGLHLEGQYNPTDVWPVTPAFVRDAEPAWSELGESGERIWRVHAIAVLQPGGARNWALNMRVTDQGSAFVECTWAPAYPHAGSVTTCWLQPLTYPWLQSWCAEFWRRRPSEFFFGPGRTPPIDHYLAAAFGNDEGEIFFGAITTSYTEVTTKPMPPLRTGLVVSGLRYSGLDAWMITRGIIPRRASDPWFAYFQRRNDPCGNLSVLFVFDARTGAALYFLHFRTAGDTLVPVQAVVNVDPRECPLRSDLGHRAMIRAVLKRVTGTDTGDATL